MKTFLTKEILLDTFFGAATGVITVLVFAGMLSLTSCNKTPDFDTPDPTPKTEQTVNQKFGMTIDSKVSPMNTKSWNVLTWQPEYSPTAVNLVVTGTGGSIGVNYTKSCTVAELKSPTGITLDMLAGTYKVTYETVHTQAGGNSLNGFSIAQLTVPKNKTVGQYLDIKIDNDVVITGSPLNLVATLQDALVVVDIPEITSAYRQAYPSPEIICSKFLDLKKATDGIFYGYVNAQPLYVSLEASGWQAQKVVDLTTAVNGNAYHLVTPFNAAVVLNIPNLEAHQIIVP